MFTFKGNSKIEMRYRDPIGKYPRIQYWFNESLTGAQKIERLEKDLKKEIPPNMTFEKVDDIKRFIHHFEYRFLHKLKEKVFGIYMGVFWLVCPFSNKTNCPFQLKFTRYTVNHLIVLNKAWFRHNHNPWEEIPRSKPSNALDFDVANRIKQKLPIFKISLKKNHKLNKKRSDGQSDDEEVIVLESQSSWSEISKSNAESLSSIKNNNISKINVNNSSHTNDQLFEVTVHPRRQVENIVNQPRIHARKKPKSDIITIGSFSITQQLIKELKIKSLYGDSKENIEQYAFSKIFGDTTPSSSDILKAKRAISGSISDSNINSSIELNTENIKEILAQKYAQKQDCYDILDEQSQTIVGLLIIVKNNRNDSSDYFEGYYMADTTIQLNTWFKSKSILIYQVDKFLWISLRAIIILKTYTVETAYQALVCLYEQVGKIELLVVDYDELFIQATQKLKEYKNSDFIISSYRILKEVFNVLKIHKGVNGSEIESTMMRFLSKQSFSTAWEYWNSKIKPELEKYTDSTDTNKTSLIINVVTNYVDKLWNEDLMKIEFSKLFSDEIVTTYANWANQYSKNISRNFSKAYGFLITESSLNQEVMNKTVWSIIGFRHEILSKLFFNQTIQNNTAVQKSKTFQEAEKLFIEHICTKYSPAVVHEVLKSYILSKLWKVKIPNIAEEIVKSKQESKATGNSFVIKSEILVTEYDVNNKDWSSEFRINPQNLLWSWRKYVVQGIACCHLIAYLVQGLNLHVDDVCKNGYLISTEWIVTDASRFEKIYSQYLNGKTPPKVHQKKSELKLLEATVINFNSVPCVKHVELVFLSDAECETESDQDNGDEEYKCGNQKENFRKMTIKNSKSKLENNKQNRYNLRNNSNSKQKSKIVSRTSKVEIKWDRYNSNTKDISPDRLSDYSEHSFKPELKSYSEYINSYFPPSLS